MCWEVKGRGLIDRARGLVWLAGIGVLFAAGVVLTDWWTESPELARSAPRRRDRRDQRGGMGCSPRGGSRTVASRSGPCSRRPLVGAVALEVLKVAAGIWVPRLINKSSELWGAIGVVFAIIAWILVFGRVVVYVAVIEVLEAERLGTKSPRGTNLLP